MNKVMGLATKMVVKYGAVIASCAFAVVAISANTSCAFPYYEPEEPQGMENFKKISERR